MQNGIYTLLQMLRSTMAFALGSAQQASSQFALKKLCLGPLLPTRHANLSRAPQLSNQGLNEKKLKDNEGSAVERTASKVPNIIKNSFLDIVTNSLKRTL